MKKIIVIIVLVSMILISSSKADVLVLQTSGSENLEDTVIKSDIDSPAGIIPTIEFANETTKTHHSLIKFNISAIPEGKQIDNAVLTLWISNNKLDSDTEGYNITAHHVNNQSWDELELKWSLFASLGEWNRVGDGSIKFFGGAGEYDDQYLNWSVTNIVSDSYNDGESNTTIFLRTHEKYGSPSNDYLQMSSKEDGTTAHRPMLTITYSDAPVVSDPLPEILTFKYKINNFTSVYPDRICWYFSDNNEFCINSTNIIENVTAESFCLKGNCVDDWDDLNVSTNLNGTSVSFTNVENTGRYRSTLNDQNKPSYSFASDPDSGLFWRPTYGIPWMVKDGNRIMGFMSSYVWVNTAGSEASPGLIVNDQDCGIFSLGNGRSGYACDDQEYWFIYGTQASSTPPNEMVFNDDGDSGINYRYETDTEDYALLVNGTSNNIGMFTSNPNYPLEVNRNVSGISIYSQANISATGYNTRTSIYDKTKGKALDYIKDADDYVSLGNIDHSTFYGYAGEIEVTDYSRPKQIVRNMTDYDNKTKTYYNYTELVTTYPYTKTVGQISLDQEVNMMRQALYELKTENELIKTELCKKDITYKWRN